MKTTPKKNGGFTLVELIVVIAILAILAAVAIPAYSGYIEKAEKAGDLQILGAINTAFAAACLDGGFSIYEVQAASIPVASDGSIGDPNGTMAATAGTGVTYISSLVVENVTVDVTKVNDAFTLFFSGNETSKFKTIQGRSLFFAPEEGGFVDPLEYEGALNAAYGDKVVSIPGTAVYAYNNSNWGDVASSDVLGLVGSVTDFAGAVDNDTFLAMLGDPAYMSAAAAALGVAPEDYDATFTAMLESAETKYLKENPDATDEELEAYMGTVSGQIMANNAVLVAAQNAEANKGAIIGLLTQNDGVGAKAAIGAAMSSDPANGLAQASLAYGLYTSYMLDKNPNYDTTTNPDPLVVMNTLDDPDFQTYLKSDKATTDLDGFASVLDAAGKNTGNGVGTDIVQNGFADNKELQDMMQQILGK